MTMVFRVQGGSGRELKDASSPGAQISIQQLQGLTSSDPVFTYVLNNPARDAFVITSKDGGSRFSKVNAYGKSVGHAITLPDVQAGQGYAASDGTFVHVGLFKPDSNHRSPTFVVATMGPSGAVTNASSYQVGDGAAISSDLQATSNGKGGTVLVGNYIDKGSNSSCMVVNIANNGTVLFANTYSPRAIPESRNAKGAQCVTTKAGEILVAGVCCQEASPFVFKLKADGTLARPGSWVPWPRLAGEVTIGGLGELTDGSIVVAYNKAGKNGTASNCYLTRLSPSHDGSSMHPTAYQLSYNNDTACQVSKLTLAPNGEIIATGTLNGTQASSNMFTARLGMRKEGNHKELYVIEANRFQTNSSRGDSGAVYPDGSILAAGQHSETETLVMKLNSAGQVPECSLLEEISLSRESSDPLYVGALWQATRLGLDSENLTLRETSRPIPVGKLLCSFNNASAWILNLLLNSYD